MEVKKIADQIVKRNKVFLGGTCNESKWRDFFKENLEIDYFDPIVSDWTEEAQKEELRQRNICDFLLYVITPKITGVYSIAELVDDSNKRPEKTLFCFLKKDGNKIFDESQIKSLNSVGNLVSKNKAKWFKDLESVLDYLNH